MVVVVQKLKKTFCKPIEIFSRSTLVVVSIIFIYIFICLIENVIILFCDLLL